jgi:hypothetical protein
MENPNLKKKKRKKKKDIRVPICAIHEALAVLPMTI